MISRVFGTFLYEMIVKQNAENGGSFAPVDSRSVVKNVVRKTLRGACQSTGSPACRAGDYRPRGSSSRRRARLGIKADLHGRLIASVASFFESHEWDATFPCLAPLGVAAPDGALFCFLGLGNHFH